MATQMTATRDVSESGARMILITLGIMAATLMQTLDSTIVTVALPTIQGNLGATQDEGAWVVTGYIISAVIVIPLTPWLQARFGPAPVLRRRDHRFYDRVDAVRDRELDRPADRLSRDPGIVSAAGSSRPDRPRCATRFHAICSAHHKRCSPWARSSGRRSGRPSAVG